MLPTLYTVFSGHVPVHNIKRQQKQRVCALPTTFDIVPATVDRQKLMREKNKAYREIKSDGPQKHIFFSTIVMHGKF